MSHVDSHAPGSIAWMELGTTDLAGAKQFYGGLFGWTSFDIPIGPDNSYSMVRLQDRDLAGAYTLSPQMREQGIPSNWLLYVGVTDAEATAAKAKALGGECTVGPLDVPNVGRIGVMKDPQGAVIAMFQAGGHSGIGIQHVHGSLCWCDLMTRDMAGARQFYADLFGWQSHINENDPTNYVHWKTDGKEFGGGLQMDASYAGVPNHWLPYFLVDDVDQSAAKATELGGTLRVPPTPIPNTGKFALIFDPQGAAFSIFTPLPR